MRLISAACHGQPNCLLLALLAAVGLAMGEEVPERVPSFQRQVLPVLTKHGCNTGACHGKLSGQNGFRLSLRGYAPEWDHEWITQEVNGRRLNLAFPDRSLLVEKPTGGVVHDGGTRFRRGSRPWRVLVDWIGGRAPGPIADEPMPVALEVTPGEATLQPGERRTLQVQERDADGATADVTWLAQFFSNDEAVARVTPEGVVTARAPGETSVRVHFLNLVQVVRLTIPFPHEVAPAVFTGGRSPIDGPIFAKLERLRLPPSDDCGDATFVRRAFLDTIGLPPTAGEIEAFLADPSPDKRAALTDQLLNRPEWVDYWTLQLADVLQNRRERDHDVRGVKGVRAFHAWLHGQLAAGTGWDRMARALLTTRGDVRERPDIGYFITLIGEHREVEKSELPDAVAQSFLGTRIGCARCHNHPLERFTQDDFYHFAAFFARTGLDRVHPQQGGTRLVVETREEKDQRRRVEEAVTRLRDAEATGKPSDELEARRRDLLDEEKRLSEVRARPPQVIQPRTNRAVIARPLDRSALEFSPDVDPRSVLADWVVASPEFAGAMANRIWKHFFAVGLVEPVDDLRASNPPSNGPLWDLLTAEFRGHGFDLRHLMRLILTSRAYQLSSATRPENQGDSRFYSHYYARRLPAEVLLDAMASATGVPDSFHGYPLGLRAVQLPEPGVASYFLTLFGRSDRVTACACERRGDVSLPQLLNLRNGDELPHKLAHPAGRLTRLLATPDDDAVIEALYLSTLARRPSADERQLVRGHLATDARDAVFRDLFWALLNSKEFTFNH
ncbi:MAG: DUF1549 domain-containing protein [Verrucomicrobiales bacterium]